MVKINTRHPYNGATTQAINNGVNPNAGALNPMQYKNPAGGVPSTNGPQKVDRFVDNSGITGTADMKTALIQSEHKDFFLKYASEHITVPAHSGKTLISYVDFEVLDDRNINDQGLDQRGLVTRSGNLYGACLDIYKFNNKIPWLGEVNFRSNRIGFSRAYYEGTFRKYGFFYEYTRDSVQFDSDPNIRAKWFSKAFRVCRDIMSKLAQRDLLDMASTVVYAGTAMKPEQMGRNSIVSYGTLQKLDELFSRLGIEPNVDMTTGSTYIDTKVIPDCRVLLTTIEVANYLRTLRDPYGNPLLIPKEKYAAGGRLLDKTYEIGVIGNFRVIRVPSMMYWRGAGAPIDTSDIFNSVRSTGNRADIFPMIVLNAGAFKTISFRPLLTNKGAKVQNVGSENFRLPIEINDCPPMSSAPNFPYGTTGTVSFQWYYGMVPMNPNAIGLIKTCIPAYDTTNLLMK